MLMSTPNLTSDSTQGIQAIDPFALDFLMDLITDLKYFQDSPLPPLTPFLTVL